MRRRGEGIAIRPYFAGRLGNTSSMLDLGLSFAFDRNEQHLMMLSGEYDSFTLSGTVGISSFERWGMVDVRPRLSVTYGRVSSDAFALEGEVTDTTLSIRQKGGGTDYGELSATVEFSRAFPAGDWVVTPYVELGADWAFQQPNGGRVLTSTLALASTRALTGTATVGVRTRITPRVTAVGSVGYDSLGDGGLSVWVWRLYLSARF